MYDSRTHKPRRPGTNRYASRAWREQEDRPGEFSKPTLAAGLALGEGLDDYEYREDHDGYFDCEWASEILVPMVAASVEPSEPVADPSDALAQLHTIDAQMEGAVRRDDWLALRVYGQRFNRLCEEIEREFGFDPRTMRHRY